MKRPYEETSESVSLPFEKAVEIYSNIIWKLNRALNIDPQLTYDPARVGKYACIWAGGDSELNGIDNRTLERANDFSIRLYSRTFWSKEKDYIAICNEFGDEMAILVIDCVNKLLKENYGGSLMSSHLGSDDTSGRVRHSDEGYSF